MCSTGGMVLTGGGGEESCHGATSSAASGTWTGPGSNQGLRGEMSV